MPPLDSHINKALFYNSQGGTRLVPRWIIQVNCRIAGFDAATTDAKLDEMVARGDLVEEMDRYGRVEHAP